MAYQSFEDQQGDSNSADKLAKIRLPNDMAGKTVLDIGCNEGFFCREALRRGAARVVGLDSNAGLLEQARQRVDEAEFIAADWWHLPAERFDVILMLSAIHYEPQPSLLVQSILAHLKPGGLFILECGVIRDMKRKEWVPHQRGDGSLIYPTWRLLVEDILSGFAVRDLGASVQQSGDPVPREVFHCTPAQPVIYVLGGVSGAGKTHAARLMSKHGVPTLHTDFLIGEWKLNPQNLRLPIVKFAQDHLADNGIDRFVGKVVAAGKQAEFAEGILRFLSPDNDLSVVEGFAFSEPTIADAFTKAARAKGYRVILAAA